MLDNIEYEILKNINILKAKNIKILKCNFDFIIKESLKNLIIEKNLIDKLFKINKNKLYNFITTII
jgi:hypothetical protein